MMTTLLGLAAAILVIVGLVSILKGALLAGIILILLGLIVGPGGVSISGRRR